MAALDLKQKIAATPKAPGYVVGQMLPLADIRTDGGTQARAGVDDLTVQEYAQAMQGGADFPLIVVFHDGEAYWLADGFHRVAAALRIDRTELRAEIQSGTRRDAILYACGANASHGLRRTDADKRRAIRRLLKDEEWTKWSDSEIGRRVNVDHKTVGSVRRELESTGEIPGSPVRQSADGKARDVTGIQQANESRTQTAPTPDLSDILLRLDAHGYAKSSTREKGITTFYSFRDFKNDLDDESVGEIELAEGELPYWLAELDANAAYAQAKQEQFLDMQARFAVFDWSLRRDGKEFGLYNPNGGCVGVWKSLDAHMRQLKEMERSRANRIARGDPAYAAEIAAAALPSEDEQHQQAIERILRLAAPPAQIQQAYDHAAEIHDLALHNKMIATIDRATDTPEPATDEPVSDRAAYNAAAARDAGVLERAQNFINAREYAAARTILGGIEVATHARDQLLSTIPAGRSITLALTPDDCAALLKEAEQFATMALDRSHHYPTIGKALLLLVEAIEQS